MIKYKDIVFKFKYGGGLFIMWVSIMLIKRLSYVVCFVIYMDIFI